MSHALSNHSGSQRIETFLVKLHTVLVVGTLRLEGVRNPEEHLTLMLGMGKCIDV